MSEITKLSIVMLGASGAVGTETLKTLIELNNIRSITLLGRKNIPNINSELIHQHTIEISNSNSYINYLTGNNTAICTLGVGEPSKISKEDFVKIDKIAVLDFAKACKLAGIEHFELLSSVDINPKSVSFFLRTKGELVEELKDLNFKRLSVFEPSMILTPTNRYGISQAIVLKVWPYLNPILIFGLRKYRGIRVSILGKAIAKNILNEKTGYEVLQWDDFNLIGN
jgi:nucleoside-diphosphate-sugar epimerase